VLAANRRLHSPESERNWHFCNRVAGAFRRADAGRPQPFPWGSQLARAADYCFGPIVSRECASATAARCAVSAIVGPRAEAPRCSSRHQGGASTVITRGHDAGIVVSVDALFD